MCNLERSITVSEINLPSLQHPTPKPKNYYFLLIFLKPIITWSILIFLIVKSRLFEFEDLL